MRRVALLFLTASVGLTAAGQDSDKPFGIICQEPDCDIRRSLPTSLAAPLEAAPQLIELVRMTPVSALSHDVLGGTLDQWVPAILAIYADPGRPQFVSWSLSFCEERRTAIPRAGPDLCVDALATLVDRTVTIRIAVADGASSLDGRTGWKLHPPRVDDIYVERLENSTPTDSLHVASLGGLVTSLQMPFDKWPAVDLKTSVKWSPERWNPGDVVRFTIEIENAGSRDAERAHVNLLIGAPTKDGGTGEIRRDWFPRVPAGQKQALALSVRLPRGDAIVHVSAQPAPGPKRFREAHPDDNETTQVVETRR